MDEFESLSHSKWVCKYDVVFIPKYRRKALYVELRKPLGEIFRKLAEQRESRVEEGHLLQDHVHMLLFIPPKYAVSPSYSRLLGFWEKKVWNCVKHFTFLLEPYFLAPAMNRGAG